MTFKVVLVVLLAGCTQISKGKNQFDPSSVDLKPTNGGIYIEASIADANVLNPLLSTDSASSDINALVYNGLVKYDKDLNITGVLARTWTFSNGGKTITFILRDDVRWHDGKPFTSADALFTYEMLVASTTRTAYASDYLVVTKAEAPDKYTFRVSYEKPFATALESWGMRIIPKHIYEGQDINTHPANRNPIGTGPYTFKEWITDQRIVLEANDDYFEGRPKIDQYLYYILPDQSVQFLELRQGTLSMMAPTPDQYNGYEQFFYQYNKYRYPAFQYDYIAFNLNNPLFQDVRVRKALAHGINKKAIIDAVYQGLAVPATGPFPPTSWAFNPEVKNLDFDPEKAKSLLADAGWIDTNKDGILDKAGKNFEFTLVTNNGNDVRRMIAEISQNSLEKIGIKMEVRLIEWTVFITKYIDDKNFEAVLLGWSLSQDPDAYSIWHSEQTKKGQYNFVSYKNTEVDHLLVEGRHTIGNDKRKPIYRKIHQLIADDVPYIFLVNPESRPVVHKKIQGVEKAPAGIGWNFKDWYIPKEWQKNTLTAS